MFRYRFRRPHSLCEFAYNVARIVHHNIPKGFDRFTVVDWLNHFNGDLTLKNVNHMERMANRNPHDLLFIVFRDNPKKASYRKFWSMIRKMSYNKNIVLCPVSIVPFAGSAKSRDDQAVLLLYRALCGEFGGRNVDIWSHDKYRDAEENISQWFPPYRFAIMRSGTPLLRYTIHPNMINGIHPCNCMNCEYSYEY